VSTPEEKRQMMEAQVVAKVRWGTRDAEVLDWLREKHAIVDDEAHRLLQRAKQLRAAAIRRRALITVLVTSLALIPVTWYLFAVGNSAKDSRHLSRFHALAWAAALALVTILARNLTRLFSGHAEGAVDDPVHR
jgi:hypothetical protein